MWRYCVLACSLAVFGVSLATISTPSAAMFTHAAKPCGAATNFVGMTLAQTRAFARRCHVILGYVFEVPGAAPPGTVISQSLPSFGNSVVVSTGPLTNTRGVLRGAQAPPVTAECAATIHLTVNGNAYPLTCHGTHVNVEAWDFYAALRPRVMRLRRDMSMCQVARFIITRGLSTPENFSAFELANIYNGWRVPNGLADHVLDVGAPYHDTCSGA